MPLFDLPVEAHRAFSVAAKKALCEKKITATEWANAFNKGSLRVYRFLHGYERCDGFTYERGLKVFSTQDGPNPNLKALYTKLNIQQRIHGNENAVVGEFDLCADSQVYANLHNDGMLIYTDRAVLIKTHKIEDFFTSLTPKEKLEMVKFNEEAIYNFTREQRTDAMRLAALAHNGDLIDWFCEDERTDETCLAAVSQNGEAIRYIIGAARSVEICIAALKQDASAIQYLSRVEREHPEIKATIEMM